MPLASSFGVLLAIKIILALSVFGHFLLAMVLRRHGRLVSNVFRNIHLSVFGHVVGIVVLAKAMFFLQW